MRKFPFFMTKNEGVRPKAPVFLQRAYCKIVSYSLPLQTKTGEGDDTYHLFFRRILGFLPPAATQSQGKIRLCTQHSPHGTRHNHKFIKHLENTDLYEMRVSVATNEYRTILFAIDHDNILNATKIFVLNAFLKKSTKDYKKQIETALHILGGLSDDTL